MPSNIRPSPSSSLGDFHLDDHFHDQRDSNHGHSMCNIMIHTCYYNTVPPSQSYATRPCQTTLLYLAQPF